MYIYIYIYIFTHSLTSTTIGEVVQRHASAFLTPKADLVLILREIVWATEQVWAVRKISPTMGSDTRIILFVASHYSPFDPCRWRIVRHLWRHLLVLGFFILLGMVAYDVIAETFLSNIFYLLLLIL